MSKKVLLKAIEDAIVKENVGLKSSKEWHPKYEWAGVQARKFLKTYGLKLIPYLIWGAVFSYAYHAGGIGALLISACVSIIYVVRTVGEEIKNAF